MKKIILDNGLTVIEQKRNSNSVAIEIQVNTGSNNENIKKLGISHFLEHMMFEGTKNRTTLELANEIESLGGEINAATSNERTVFYIVVLKKHFKKALEILGDLIKNPLFSEKSVEKERKVILEEINMINDSPHNYQWILFQKTLFKKHPTKNPIAGFRNTVQNITRQDIIDYHKNYYSSNNMTVIVSGLDGVTDQIKKEFGSLKVQKTPEFKQVEEPKQVKEEVVEKKQLEQSYLVLGYKTVPRSHKDSYVLDVIQAILAKGQSSRLFNELRIKKGLAYNLGAENEVNKNYGYFAMYAGVHKSHLNEVKQIFLEQSKLNGLTNQEIKDAITYIEGHVSLELEMNKENVDWIAFWNSIDFKKIDSYINTIKKITKQDIQRVVKAYFNNPVSVILEQK